VSNGQLCRCGHGIVLHGPTCDYDGCPCMGFVAPSDDVKPYAPLPMTSEQIDRRIDFYREQWRLCQQPDGNREWINVFEDMIDALDTARAGLEDRERLGGLLDEAAQMLERSADRADDEEALYDLLWRIKTQRSGLGAGGEG
jgi:hypothetical protein